VTQLAARAKLLYAVKFFLVKSAVLAGDTQAPLGKQGERFGKVARTDEDGKSARLFAPDQIASAEFYEGECGIAGK
jgi:hypothetical protein